MPDRAIHFEPGQLNRLFPYYLLLGDGMQVTGAGRSFRKLMPDAPGLPMGEVFSIVRPSIQIQHFGDLELLKNQIVVLELPNRVNPIKLRGQIEYITESNEYLFVGSPWVASVDEIREQQLSLTDFSLHDATIDLLHVIQSHENVASDLKEVLDILNRKKEELKHEKEQLRKLSLVASLNENGVVFIDENELIQWANEGFIQMTGFTESEITNQYFCRPGQLQEESASSMKAMLQMLADGHSVQDEIEYTRKNGSSFWCRIKGQPFPESTNGKRQFFLIVEDVTTARKQENEMKIMSLIAADNINAVIIADASGTIEWVNKSFTKMTGFSLEEARGKKPGQFLQGPLSDPETVRFMHDQLKNGQEFTSEILNYAKSGEAYWVNIQCQPIRNQEGQLTGFFAIEENITEKKLASQRLLESEKRLSSLITNLQAAILVEDEHRRIVLTNPLFCEMFGIPVPPDQLIGADCSQSAEQVKHLFLHSETFVNDISHILHQKQLVLGDVLELADGRFFSRDYIPIYIDEQYRGHLWKYTDITAERLAQNALLIREEKYRSIIANMNLGLLEVDVDEVIQFANNSFCEMSGYTMSELVGKSAPDLFTEQDMQVISSGKNEIRRQGISDAYEIRVRNKTGDYKWWLISGAPRFNDAGEMVGSIGIHLDITEQKVLQEELRQAKEQAENAQAAEQEFLANMSHEIRTPLNAIAGMTYLLQDTSVNREQKEYLEVIQSSTEILLRLVTNILDISKIEAGKIEANEREIDLMRMLKGLEKTIRIQHKNTAVKVFFDYPKNPVKYVVSDDLLITQILLNILTNASKFTETGEIRLHAELYSNQDDKVLLNVVISDTGKGISREEQAHIFDKFIQAGDEESRAKGSGLGLAITKKLVEFLNGTIHLESTPGKGSRFTIMLPLKKAKQHPKQIAHRETPANPLYELNGYRVLVAEDNEVNRTYIGKLLHKWGVLYDFAMHGEEVLPMLRAKGPYDLILMDLQMPFKDGIEATIDVRNSGEAFSDIPIIGVSATAIIGLKHKARESGINEFVSKPYTPSQLQSAMGQFLRFRSVSEADQPAPESEPSGTFKFHPELNGNQLMELIGDDYEHAKVLFEIFESTVLPQVDESKTLFAENKPIPFSRMIHKVKPTFSMVGIPGFDQLLMQLERQAAQLTDLEPLREPFEKFLSMADHFRPIIRSEIERLQHYLKTRTAS